MPRPTVAEIDLSAIAHNLRALRKLAGEKIQVIGIVKADGYGHGAVPVSRTLSDGGVKRFAVATVEEGAALYDAQLPGSVLVLGAQGRCEIEAISDFGFEVVVSDLEFAAQLDEVARKRRRSAEVHLKFDTGMGRIGFPVEQAIKVARRIAELPGLSVVGVMTHFACADDAAGAEFTRDQIRLFTSLRQTLQAINFRIRHWHACNSGGLLQYPEARFDAVRPGIAMYGSYPSPETARPVELREAMTLKTRLAQVRDVPEGATVSYGRTWTARRPSRIGILPIGYADGWNRAASNKGHALVRGQRAPIAGRVCMDMTMVDVTDIPGAAEGDEAVLLGAQGKERISIEEVAALLGTIPNVVVTSLTARVPRVYKGGEAKKRT